MPTVSDAVEQIPSVVPIAVGRDAEDLHEEVLLLSALGIPHALRGAERAEGVDGAGGEGVELIVAASHAEQARRELVAMERAEAPVPPPVLRNGARAGIPAALALLVGHALLMSLPMARRAAIYAAGELDSMKLRHGEVFRAATALTLHADLAHVVGNAVATAIFVSAAGDWVGPGVALGCTIAAGILGNLGAALIDPGHHSIGFSTATFGALGLTAVFGFVARYRDRIGRQRAWLALGAGIALLALLGAGERSDLIAHVLGLVAGALVGVAVVRTGPLRARRPRAIGATGQALAAFASLAMLAFAWLGALR